MIRNGLILLLAAASCASAALTIAPRKGPEGNRFLFIVDTSNPMKRLENGGRQAVYDLVYSGIEERMQPGDTVGVWTFGNEVKAGVFSIQEWSPEKSADIATRISAFLKEQGSGRASRLDLVITNAESLVKSVKDVDIVIVTSANTRCKLDDTWGVLMQNFKGRLEEAKKNNKAVIVTLAGRGGYVRQATVALEGERLQLAGPPERKTAPMAQQRPAEPPAKSTREPIILRGSPKGRPIQEIPTKFAPPPAQPPAFEPAANPEPSPVPVVGPDKPVVAAPGSELTVSAREPGAARATSPQTPTGARLLIIVGAALMILAGVLGLWAVAYVRRRNRISYISRSLTNTPDKMQPGPS